MTHGRRQAGHRVDTQRTTSRKGPRHRATVHRVLLFTNISCLLLSCIPLALTLTSSWNLCAEDVANLEHADRLIIDGCWRRDSIFFKLSKMTNELTIDKRQTWHLSFSCKEMSTFYSMFGPILRNLFAKSSHRSPGWTLQIRIRSWKATTRRRRKRARAKVVYLARSSRQHGDDLGESRPRRGNLYRFGVIAWLGWRAALWPLIRSSDAITSSFQNLIPSRIMVNGGHSIPS